MTAFRKHGARIAVPQLPEIEGELRRLKTRRSWRRALSSTIYTLVVVAAVAVLVAMLYVSVLVVSGTSMEPNLENGDVLVGVKAERFEAGDVVCFYYNNRLLLNGNFGYTDNAMNSNNFIGDFDIEYLLTKNGNFRLKAYNRYNDQNYYIRNALTTQGVGIMFKHDFNNFLHRHRSKKAAEVSAPADTTVTK